MTSDSNAPSPRLASIDRRQLVLRTVDVERLIDDDHSARSIWELVGRLDLSLYHAHIEAVEGHAGRDHTDPQLLISLWLYAYSRGISSAREVARQCEFEPGFQWLCGLHAISHRTLSGFRSDNKAALDDLFVQVLGMLSAEGLITLERVTLDGTKIKANAGGNSFRRKEKVEAHLELAREQVRILNAEGEQEESTANRQAAAQRRAARQRASRLEAAVREVERLQQEKKHDRKEFVARASSTDPDAHVMRNGEGGTVPSYNVWRRSVTRTEEPASTTAFKTKMETEEAKQIYAHRSQIAEFPHAWIKERCGVRQFRCRGRSKVSMEATWACLSYNLARWFGIRRRFNMELASA